jgi:hypothetical protein
LAFESIAECYLKRPVYLIDRQQVLFKREVAALPFARSEKVGQSDKRELNWPPTQENSVFKTLFLAVAIAVSAAAVPAMAFVNLYATNPDARSH